MQRQTRVPLNRSQLNLANWAAVGVALLAMSLAAAFAWLHLTSPSGGAHLPDFEERVWKSGGAVVKPFQEQPDGLRSGDLLVAIDGRDMESWAQALFDPLSPRPQWQPDQEVVYTVIRDGYRLDIAATLGTHPVGPALGKGFGVLLTTLVFLVVAVYVSLRRSGHRAVTPLLVFSSCLAAGAIAWSLGLEVADLVGGVGFWLYRITVSGVYLLGWVATLHFALVFPRTHPVVARHPFLIRLIYATPLALLVAYLATTRFTAASTLQWLEHWTLGERVLIAVCVGLTALAAVGSYLNARHDAIARQQARWVVFAFAAPAALGILLGLLPEILLGHTIVEYSLLTLFFLPVPLALAMAILRYRLFDIDVIINRALVYGSLTISVVGVYVLVVGYLAALFNTGGHFAISLLATGLVAVLFQPLRDRLQRRVNRLMYGERDDPYGVISRLGKRLEATLVPQAVLPVIVETVAQALKLPYVEIALKNGDMLETAAVHGLPMGETLQLPLVYQTETVGRLALAPRAPGEPFSTADRRLLDDLALQAGVAAHTVRLTADLQRSRERLVTAREEERRRLRRDLHDGLGPMLASFTLKLDAARNLRTRDPAAADALLQELKAQTQAAIGEIRRLVYELRPPALDDLGLISAIREYAVHYISDGDEELDSAPDDGRERLRVGVDVPDSLPPLPAAVEVAAYRIALEALTNVVRHAHARTCVVHLSMENRNALRLEVCDDGLGMPAERRTGVGLTSMRERASELGGTCVIESAPGGGTRVLACLPMPSPQGLESDGWPRHS